MTTFTEPSRNNAVESDISKNSTSFMQFLKHGKNPTIQDLENFTFESVVFEDGTILENVTFEQLANTVWSLVQKST